MGGAGEQFFNYKYVHAKSESEPVKLSPPTSSLLFPMKHVYQRESRHAHFTTMILVRLELGLSGLVGVGGCY